MLGLKKIYGLVAFNGVEPSCRHMFTAFSDQDAINYAKKHLKECLDSITSQTIHTLVASDEDPKYLKSFEKIYQYNIGIDDSSSNPSSFHN